MCLFFPLPRSSSLSLVWQNWCCRLTRETWTSCWDLWMITWRRPLWKKRMVFRIPTTTLRGPAPVSKQAHHSVRVPTVAKDIFSPPSSEMLWPVGQEGAWLVSIFVNWWRYMELNAVSSSSQQRDNCLAWSLTSAAASEGYIQGQSHYCIPSPFLSCFFKKNVIRRIPIHKWIGHVWVHIKELCSLCCSEYTCYSKVAKGQRLIIYTWKFKPSREGLIYTMDLFPHSRRACAMFSDLSECRTC